MEIINSKNLHKHAVPVVILLTGLLIVSTMALYGSSTTAVARGLTTRVIDIKPSSKGLANVSLRQTETPPLNLNQAGQTAQYYFVIKLLN